MVDVTQDVEIDQIWKWLSEIPDPEIPVISLTELGVIRSVSYEDDLLIVRLSPTYSGCPATNVIKRDVEAKLTSVGLASFRVEQQLSPPWSSAWITPEGQAKLKDYGIAPPNFNDRSDKAGVPLSCPRCESQLLEKISQFGSTPCKALWRCKVCREPFDYFKCI